MIGMRCAGDGVMGRAPPCGLQHPVQRRRAVGRGQQQKRPRRQFQIGQLQPPNTTIRAVKGPGPTLSQTGPKRNKGPPDQRATLCQFVHLFNILLV